MTSIKNFFSNLTKRQIELLILAFVVGIVLTIITIMQINQYGLFIFIDFVITLSVIFMVVSKFPELIEKFKKAGK